MSTQKRVLLLEQALVASAREVGRGITAG